MGEPTAISDERREELRVRYRAERDKRLRGDGNNQYLEPTGRFAGITDDPYTERVERDSVHDDVTVAVVGAGFSGLVTGAALKKAGIEDIRLLDAAGDVGGVWYWNRYPGAMCDTAAMIYLPLLEETGTVPSAKYVPAHEIFAHAQSIATTFNLYDNALLSTSVTRFLGMNRRPVGVSRPIEATISLPNFWRREPGPCIVQNCRASMELTRLKVTLFTQVDGTTSIAGEAPPTSRWTNLVTSE